jgi:NAD(P)-dependent dehydrogenase (short-subunit alcohol dehydrogenase family)
MNDLARTLADYRPPRDLLAGRVILVIGATGGLGRMASLAFARHGATVVIHGRDEKKLESIYDAIRAEGAPEPALLPLDMYRAKERDYDHVAHIVATQLGRLDGILHSAVHLDKLSPLADQTLDDWDNALRIYLVGPMLLTRACLPLLKASPQSSVIFTIEEHALSGSPLWGAFAATGAALACAVRIQAGELAGAPRINALVPGAVHSPLRQQTHPGESPRTRASADSLANRYLYLMGPDSAAVNGEIIHCQG